MAKDEAMRRVLLRKSKTGGNRKWLIFADFEKGRKCKKIDIWSDFAFCIFIFRKQSYANATGRILWALDVRAG